VDLYGFGVVVGMVSVVVDTVLLSGGIFYEPPLSQASKSGGICLEIFHFVCHCTTSQNHIFRSGI